MNNEKMKGKLVSRPKIDVRHFGDNREYGMAIGSELMPQIVMARQSMTTYETFVRACPWWMPFSFYEYMARRKARTLLQPGITKKFPQMADRIDGIAEGANTTVDFLYLFHALESLTVGSSDVYQPAMAGCSAVAIKDERTNEAVIAHNFDLVELASELLVVREHGGTDRFRTLGFTLAPMAGIINGINEAGLAISYNYVPSTDVRFADPPLSFAIEEALSKCATIRQAIKLLCRAPRAAGALLMLADAKGHAASLELSSRHRKVRKTSPGQRAIFHTNAYQSNRMRRYELPRTAIYTNQAPQPLRNVRVFQSAEQRDQRLSQFLHSASIPRTMDELELIMSDHGPDGIASADTICMHGDYWSTLSSVRLFPRQRRMRISYGPACHADFVDLSL